MLYEVITPHLAPGLAGRLNQNLAKGFAPHVVGAGAGDQGVITSYSIHYTKLYDFSGLLRPALTDRVALFLVGSDNGSPVESKYLGQKSEGELQFTAPTLPGRYEFRLLPANSEAATATSPAISVAAQ